MSETTVGREPIQVVQIDQDFCNLTYGTAPCTAQVGVTGTRKCFNTRATCQDPDNYDRGTLTLTFTLPRPGAPSDLYARPSLNGVSTRPTQLNIGGGSDNEGPLGTRESVTATFQDHADPDRQVDKYLSDRSYDPLERGTFWTKWLARNPYYQNRKMRVYNGYAGQSLAQMQSRSYFIDKITGPDSSGSVSVQAKDILKLADDKRAQAPAVSTGTLVADISDSATTFDVTASASDYDSSGDVRIGDEVISYTSLADNGDGTLTFSGLTRGAEGTTAESHSEDDTVQRCLRFSAAPVWEIIRDLLQDYAGIDSSFIPYSDWQTEGSNWLTQFNQLSTIITEPTGVNELLGELTQQCLLFLWWDSELQEIGFRAIRPSTETVKSVNDDDNIIADSAVQRQDPDQRISQVWVYYDRRNAVESITDEQNYQKVRILVDSDAESAEQYGEARVKRIFSRWLASEAQAIYTSNRILAAYRNNPRFVRLRLDAKDRSLWIADPVNVTHRRIVDDTGSPQTERWVVIKAEEVQPGEVVQYDLQTAQVFGRLGVWMESDAPDYASATPAQKQRGCWWADSNGKLGSSDDDAYDWI